MGRFFSLTSVPLASRSIAMPLVVLLAFVPAGAAQTTSRTAAERVVNADGHPIELPLPPGSAAFNVLRRVLDSAGVPYGIEEAPSPQDVEPIDLAPKPDRVIRLDGMTVGAALNTIVQHDPRYEWNENGGRILVRAGSVRGSSALDARLERFNVSRVSFIGGLQALVRAFDPARPQPAIYRFGVKPGVGDRTDRQTPTTRQSADEGLLFTLDVANATVLDILEAIAAAHGRLSWSIQYDGAEAGIEHATISMMGEEASAVAASVRASREIARSHERVLLPVRRSIGMMLSMYSQRAGVPFGFESLEGIPLDLSAPGTTLDLTGLSRDVAVRRIVDLDSRFEVEDVGGIFNVRPKGNGTGDGSWLDARVDSFEVNDATIDGVFGALAQALGAIETGRAGSEGGPFGVTDPQEQRRRVLESRARRVSITLGSATVREILNEVARAHGSLSWTVRPATPAQGPRAFDVGFESWDGWSASRTLSLREP
jgi:hypothetical protein